MTAPDAASLRQAEAADPRANTWLGANAGSGKTRVLIDRVARLLLDGTAPQRILCLTYTKAAAGEMQNRLFERLGRWAMLDEARLRDELTTLEADALDTGALVRARRLFARAIETPGGLKIQTIHAFCAGLLRRFPLEAGVSPAFTEMDDRQQTLLLEDIADRLAETAAPTFDAFARHLGGAELLPLLRDLTRRREAFTPPLTRDGALSLFALPPGYTAATLLTETFAPGDAALIARLIPVLAGGSSNDVKAAGKLTSLAFDPPGLETLTTLENLLLFGADAKKAAPFSAKIGSFPTKATQAALGPNLAPLNALMQRIEDARPRRLALAAAERTAALHAFAATFLRHLDTAKATRSLLTFDDLIARTQALLTDPSVAQWVLYKLDGGVDHILVDEAQDTSPEQWAVIERLADEMTAGDDGRARTLFVVGDRKQSIYSFQGADLATFDSVRDRFDTRLAAARRGLNKLTLEHSFRSSPAILGLVDLTFDDRRGRGLGGEVRHRAFHPDFPGRVDLWPTVEKNDTPPDPDWWEPVDILSEEHHTARLASTIAEEIAGMLSAKAPLPHPTKPPRPIRPGDILILVRRRNALFHRLITECKARGLPIAGADVMRLGAELAVRDLTALLSFLATPEDDLSLATLLRSPLGGWSEQELFTLAHPREGFLWAALRDAPEHAETRAWLTELLSATDFLRPYNLLERALTRHGARARLIARLGPEAEDGIDALLAQALAFETTEIPSLTGFLTWLEAGEVDIRRRPDGTGDLIRVMTVHGAKGLESPIVILPDTAERRAPRDAPLAPLPNPGGRNTDTIAWKTPRADAPPALAAAMEAEAQARAEEDARLLYVAMTRAECWLIAAAAGKVEKDCWHARLREAMEHAGAVAHPFPTGEGLRHATGHWPEAAPPLEAQLTPTISPPAWALAPPPPADESLPALTPTGLGGAKALPAEPTAVFDEAASLRRGLCLHLLLEHLPTVPRPDRAAAARDILAAAEGTDDGHQTLPTLGPDTGDDLPSLLAEAEAILDAPDLAFLFAQDALAEVDLTADLGPRRLIGTIDRLILTPGRALAVDWKSNAVIPATPEATPEGLLRQMGAYRHALKQIFPDRRIDTALLWTRAPRLMLLPAPLTQAALARACAELGLPPIDPTPPHP